MRKAMRVVLAVGCLASAVTIIQQSAASAAPGTVTLVVEGGGAITPGNTMTPTFQSGTFSGTIVGGGWAVPGTPAGIGSCNFTFASTIPETALQGQGTFTGSCYGAQIGTIGIGVLGGCVIDYVRVGTLMITDMVPGACVWTSTGPLGTGSATSVAGVGVYLWLPTAGNGVTTPMTAYALSGAEDDAGI